MSSSPVSPEIVRNANPNGACSASPLVIESLDFDCLSSTLKEESTQTKKVVSNSDLIRNAEFVYEEDDDVSAANDNDAAFLLTPSAGSINLSSAQSPGSPGHTPFPRPSHPREMTMGPPPTPPVPFNSPDDGMLEEILMREARKQERELHDRLTDEGLLHELPKKRFRDLSGHEGAAAAVLQQLEILSKEERISPHGTDDTGSEREAAKKIRVNKSLDLIKRIVPGVTDQTDRSDMYEMTAKYILFLKKKVGTKYDRDFLQEFMPY